MTGDMGGEMKVTARSELCWRVAQFAAHSCCWSVSRATSQLSPARGSQAASLPTEPRPLGGTVHERVVTPGNAPAAPETEALRAQRGEWSFPPPTWQTLLTSSCWETRRGQDEALSSLLCPKIL